MSPKPRHTLFLYPLENKFIHIRPKCIFSRKNHKGLYKRAQHLNILIFRNQNTDSLTTSDSNCPHLLPNSRFTYFVILRMDCRL